MYQSARLPLAFVLAGFCLSAQTSTTLNGTILDNSGAVVPNASVSAENQSTGATRKAASDSAGFYAFPQIPSGTYKVTASAPGFATTTVESVQVLVNVPTTLPIRLEVAAVSQSVEVTAGATLVNVTDASIGNAFGTAPILQLPLEGRNVVGLLALQPGVAFIGENQTDSRNGAVNGGKSDQANVTLDGVDVNDQQERSAFTSVLRVTLDSVQEFRVTTTNANAEQGRSSGAQIALVTKSGTNALHGSLYEFHRNTITTANSFLNNAAQPGVPRPKLIRNTFGAAVGGPVKKNRLFYFFNYEGRRDAKESTVERTVPTESLRNGSVRYESTNGGVAEMGPAEIRNADPLGIGVSPRVLDVYKSYPLPNTFSVGDGLNIAGFRFVAPRPLRWNTYIARFDYNPADDGRHMLFLRGNLQNDRDVQTPQFPAQEPNSVNLDNSKGLAAGYTAVITPNLIGSFRYGYTRQGGESSGLQNASAVQFFSVSDPVGLTTAFKRIIPVHNTTQDMTWTRRKHTVQFGAVQRFISNARTNYATSFHTAQTRASRLAGSGGQLDPPDLSRNSRDPFRNSLVDVMGVISTASANYNYDLQGNVQPVGDPVQRTFIGHEYEFYGQDVWRVSRGLTITAGLRWSLMPPIYEANGLQISTNPTFEDWFNQRGGLADAGKPAGSVVPLRYIPAGQPGATDLYPYHKKNFAPRVALAWSPQSDSGTLGWLFGGPGRTSIRAGWGMYYDLMGQSLMRNSDTNSFGLQTSLQTAGSAYNFGTAPRFEGVFTFPAGLVPPPPEQEFPVDAPRTFARGAGVDAALQPPYTMNMNFSIGREFRGGFHVQGSYVGRLSRRSLIQSDIATPTNLTDPKSGMDYYTAARQLAIAARQRVPANQVGPIAFWENLWPGAAGNGLTATQRIYEQYRAVDPSYVDALELIDREVNCRPSCSILGPHAMYDPQFASFTAWRSIAGGSYHAMQWTVRKRFAHGVQFDLNYTWSKSIDLGSRAERDTSGNLGLIPNPWNPGQRKAVSDYDMTHQWNANWVVELPFGRGKKWMNARKGFSEALLGGWQIAGLWRQTSGLPVSVSNGRNWPTNWQWQANATQIGPVPEPHTSRNVAGRVNAFPDPAAVLAAYDFTYPGEVGQRNGIRGDGYFTIDGSLSKRFGLPYAESHSLQFRWEVFNVTNTARFDVRQMSLDLGSLATFGRYSGMLTEPRVMQFGLRYEF
jgi:hypothetical protein